MGENGKKMKHTDKCMDSLWRQMGFVTNIKDLIRFKEGKKMYDSWLIMDVESIIENMKTIYDKIYSHDYKIASKWVKACF